MYIDEWSESTSVVADILQVDDFAAFLERHWEKSVCHARIGSVGESSRRAAICRLLNLAQVEQLIVAAPSGTDSAVSIVENFVAQPIFGGSGNSRGLTIAMEAFSRGATLLVPGLQHRLRRVRDLCRQFDNTMLSYGLPLKQATTANAYVTPPQAQGFGVHYDNHCAVILQLHGSKTWTVYAPQDPLPVRRCTSVIAEDALGEIVMSVRLEPGDVLYVPRGFAHCAMSDNDASLHVTLGIFAATWSDLLASLASDIPALRAAVRPSPGDGLSATQFYTSRMLPALGRSEITEMLQQRLAESLTELPPLPGDRLQSLARVSQLTPASRLARSPLVLVMVQLEGGDAVLRCPGCRLVLPCALLPALEFIADNDFFYASDIPTGGAALDPLELVRLLTRHGVLTIVSPPEPQDEARGPEVATHVTP